MNATFLNPVEHPLTANTIHSHRHVDALHPCPSCGATGMWIFHEVRHVPAHSVLLLPTREEALHYPKGNITLGLCHTCGFIGNTRFDPRLNQYDGEYEATQGFSSTFNQFHRRLAEHLIERFHLREKTVVEIGCGQGEFLHLLSEMGNCKGVGFDPAFSTRHGGQTDNPHVQIIKDFYSERYTNVHGDLFCCKMTLEHIPDVRTFLMLVRRSIGNRRNTPVFSRYRTPAMSSPKDPSGIFTMNTVHTLHQDG
jgi:hypothetical protein